MTINDISSVLPALALSGHKKGEENAPVALWIARKCTCPKGSDPQANALSLDILPHTCINTAGTYPYRYPAQNTHKDSHAFLYLNTTVTHLPVY